MALWSILCGFILMYFCRVCCLGHSALWCGILLYGSGGAVCCIWCWVIFEYFSVLYNYFRLLAPSVVWHRTLVVSSVMRCVMRCANCVLWVWGVLKASHQQCYMFGLQSKGHAVGYVDYKASENRRRSRGEDRVWDRRTDPASLRQADRRTSLIRSVYSTEPRGHIATPSDNGARR